MRHNWKVGAALGVGASVAVGTWLALRGSTPASAEAGASRLEQSRPPLRAAEQEPVPNRRDDVLADPTRPQGQQGRRDERPSDGTRLDTSRGARRVEADAIRQRIRQRKERGEATHRSAAVARTVSEAQQKAYVQQAVREQYLPVAKTCYEELLSRDPEADGRVVVRFSIVGDGESGGVVDRVELTDETTFEDEDFSHCMRESMFASIFEPPPEGVPEVTVVYPLELSQ